MKVGPKYKICKRLGSNVFEKCQTQKFALAESRNKNQRRRRGSRSDYAVQLLEKQKVRYTYGMTEKQFRRYVDEALGSNKDTPINLLYRRLESRLDNVVFRLGLSKSRRMARQIVSHGHVTVNGRKVTIPSYEVKQGDVISVRDGSKDKKLWVDLEDEDRRYSPPQWLTFELGKKTGTKDGEPTFEPGESLFDLGKVFEYYSR